MSSGSRDPELDDAAAPSPPTGTGEVDDAAAPSVPTGTEELEDFELPTGDLGDIRSVLRAHGVSGEDVDRARHDGTLGYLAIDHLIFPDPPVYDLEALADVTGMPADQVAQLWRSLGFPDPTRGERIFTETDADMLGTVAGLMELGLIEPDLVVQMGRVIGSSLSRVAGAVIGAIGLDDNRGLSDDDELAMAAGTLLPTMPKVMDYVWRRHLQAAARRRVAAHAAGAGPSPVTVGFADLVGFTSLSQELDEHELAAVVDHFETLAYDTVVRRGGRVVKMIGDEVMFVVDDVGAALEIGLGLAEVYADATDLSDVRVGLATGPVLEREADYYGPTVNLASRIVNIAFPGSVVTSDEVHTALEGRPGFAWRSLRQHRLKDIGRVRLWTVRRDDDGDGSSSGDRARRRQAERRARRQARDAHDDGDADVDGDVDGGSGPPTDPTSRLCG